ELIAERQVADVEGGQPEDRSPHQDQHHPHDEAQANHELQPYGPTGHDDLLVVVSQGHRRWTATRRRRVVVYQIPAIGSKPLSRTESLVMSHWLKLPLKRPQGFFSLNE